MGPPTPSGGGAANNRDNGTGLRAYLVKEFKYGNLPAIAVCSIAYHATRAGAVGVEDMAMDPESRHQAEHLRDALNARSSAAFFVGSVPMWDSRTEDRAFSPFPLSLPHEEFARVWAKHPWELDVANAEEDSLPATLYDHPAYHERGDGAVPVGLFSDAVPHTKKESFIVWYWSNLVTRQRRLICALRKSDMCRCGCRGYCTLGAVQRIISWSFNVLAGGEFPSRRHDGEPFTDDARLRQIGTQLADGRAGALVEMRADLLEIVQACGFKTWSNVKTPCFCCDCSKANLFKFPPCMEASTWEPKDAEKYNEELQTAMLKTVVETPEMLRRLCAELYFAPTKDGPGGLTLHRDFDDLGLPAGARLLEDGPIFDLHAVEKTTTPCTLTFFDTRGDHSLNFVCPLFNIAGFTIEAMCLDVMHILDLGVTQYLIGWVFSTLIEANFAQSQEVYVFASRRENIRHLRRRLAVYYKSLGRSRGTMSAIGNLTLLMIGPNTNPRLKAKAAESRNLVPLLTQLCSENSDLLGEGGMHLKLCCTLLDRFYQIMREQPRRMPEASLAELQSCMSRYLVNWVALGGHCVYKHHAAWHLAERAGRLGNPRFYWTYTDEQENRVMGKVAKSLHGGPTFYMAFLQKVLPEIAA